MTIQEELKDMGRMVSEACTQRNYANARLRAALAALKLAKEALLMTFEGRMKIQADGSWLPPPWFMEALAAIEAVLGVEK